MVRAFGLLAVTLGLGLGLGLGLVLGTPVRAAVPEGSIEAFIDVEMPASGVPGLAYAIVIDGEIETLGARGVARLGDDEAMTPDTPLSIGSISKSFTALAVMQLVEAKAVDLDAAVSRYLPSFSGEPAGSITIRHLLSHTSGFSTLQGNTSHTDRAGGEDALARCVDPVARLEPASAPDAQWAYSNVNYQILGRVIEVVSGQDYQTYITAHILEPVGMANSFVGDGEVHDEMAAGHRPWFGTKRPLPRGGTERCTAPQGGIVASAHDVALYLRVMMNGEDDILSAAGKAEMLRPASETSPHYGFGWFLDPEAGSVWHAGSTPGFETLATVIPSRHAGVVVLVNAGSGLGFGETTELIRGITARALGLDYDGEGSRWAQKALFIGLTLGPFGFGLGMVWAWRKRVVLRAKRGGGAFGRFSLWFPLVTTGAGAWVILGLVPRLFGVPIETLRLFQPDFGLILIAFAMAGVSWAVFRLAVAYTGPSPAPVELEASG